MHDECLRTVTVKFLKRCVLPMVVGRPLSKNQLSCKTESSILSLRLIGFPLLVKKEIKNMLSIFDGNCEHELTCTVSCTDT